MKNETTIEDYALLHDILKDDTADMAWVDCGDYDDGFSTRLIKKEHVDPSIHHTIVPAWSFMKLISMLPCEQYSHESVIPYVLTITKTMEGHWVAMYHNDAFKPGYKTLMEAQGEELIECIIELISRVYPH